ncbi:MAG: GUN4 domain-containing protein [Cyanobacteria bacterium P01_F01_bin.3]
MLLSISDEWRDTAVLYSAITTPAKLTTLIEQLCDKAANGESPEASRQVLILAYDCWLENTRALPEATRTRIQALCYGELEKCMQAGEWNEADDYTYRLMGQVLGKRYGEYFSSDEMLTFPCADLLRIDGLWVKHSQGRFGFSVQKEIYVRCGGVLDGKYAEKPYVQFFQAVGWCKEGSKQYDTAKEIIEADAIRNYTDYIFSPEKAVEGHLPERRKWFFPISLLSHPYL